MDEGRALRAALETTQAKLKRVTQELAALKSAPKAREDAAARLAHLERSAVEREARDEHRLGEHRARERALRDRAEALEQALAAEATAHRETRRQLAALLKAKQRRPPSKSGLVALVQAATHGKRVKRLEAELDTARAEVARLNGLLSRTGGRRAR